MITLEHSLSLSAWDLIGYSINKIFKSHLKFNEDLIGRLISAVRLVSLINVIDYNMIKYRS